MFFLTGTFLSGHYCKMTLKALLHLSMLMTSQPGEIRSVQPPYAVMRVFASVGRLLGYQV